MNGNPTAAQKRFHEWCRENGCIECFDKNPSIHHIKGSKMKLKGCVKPGEWFVIPLCYKHHQGPRGIHASKKAFEYLYGTEKELWDDIIAIYEEEHGHKPMSEEEYQIILERG